MRLSCGLTVMVAVCLLVTEADAQKATEMLIPVGQSPGVSGISSVIGTIASCEQASGIVTISTEKEQHTARLTDETKIWLDRSAVKKGGAVGSRSACQKGRRSEVKYVYEGKTRSARAEWIKIQAE
jgi:hypothetical protein